MSRCALERPWLAVACLVALAAIGAHTVAASESYTCPVGAPVDDSQLCGDGSVIVLVRQPGDKFQLAHYLDRQIQLAQRRSLLERLPDPMRGRLAELVPDVRALRSFPNVFVVRFANGLATQRRLDRLAFDLCDALRNSPVHGSGGCHESRTSVRLEPALKLQLHAGAPDDPYFAGDESNQWNLKKHAGIKAPAAWSRTGTVSGLSPVQVAILDTGSTAVVGELDNLMNDGADFTANPPTLTNPVDDVGHGTKVASVLAARTNNTTAMAGVTWSGSGHDGVATLMPVKVMGSSGANARAQCTSVLLDALPYAVDPRGEITARNSEAGAIWDLLSAPDASLGPFRPARGARVVNLSAGYGECSTDIGETLRRIGQYFPDVLFVTAVPNVDEDPLHMNRNMDGSPAAPNYPTSYRFDNILSVTATGDSRCVTGKYGKTSVDIAAPGDTIVVLDGINAKPQTASGTSFAAPHVSGAAALLKALAPPDWQYRQIRQYLMNSSDHSMCTFTGANGGCAGITNWPTICDGVASGLLDLDAATAPPVTAVTALSSGGLPAAIWTTARPATVSWQQAFDPGPCPQVDIDLLVDQSTGAPAEAKLSATPVNVAAQSATFDAATLAAAASAAMPSGSEAAQARVRLQCPGSHLFRTSQDFTLRRSD